MKDYMKDNGKVRICTSNVAKMNIFEWMWYNRFRLKKAIRETLDNCVHTTLNTSILIFLPMTYPIIAYFRIKNAKKEMREHDKK